MKFAGCLSLFLFFTFCGIYGSNQLEKRIRQLKSLNKAVLFMKREIDYHMTPLAETLLHTAARTEYPWCLFFEKAGKNFQERREGICCPDEIFEKELKGMRNYHPWDKELDVLLRLGKCLGELDKHTQILQLSIAEEELSSLIHEAEEEKRTKGKLYRTLGVCMGMLSVILIM
jgi:stage III sporulation protein AB